MTERFELTETLDIRDNLTEVIYPVDIIRNHPKQICVLLNDLNYKKELIMEGNKQLQQQLRYIQSSISNAIKQSKTELEQKALQNIIGDYNEWMLGHKGEEE